jgi:hypothetical protein
MFFLQSKWILCLIFQDDLEKLNANLYSLLLHVQNDIRTVHLAALEDL